MKRKLKIFLPILCGMVIGIILFVLGNEDDAPGLSFIGIIVAFLLTMRGIYHAKLFPNGYLIPLVVIVFGLIAICFPIILYLDGEISSWPIPFGIIIGIILIAYAVLRMRKIKIAKYEI